MDGEALWQIDGIVEKGKVLWNMEGIVRKERLHGKWKALWKKGGFREKLWDFEKGKALWNMEDIMEKGRLF